MYNLTATDTRGDKLPSVVFTGTEMECLRAFHLKCGYSFMNHKFYSSIHYNLDKL
jgi:hypothetical protein